MNKIAVALVMVLLLSGCRDKFLKGDLVILSEGEDIVQTTMGLYDASMALSSAAFPGSAALMTRTFRNGKAEFNTINPGNYIVAIVGSRRYRAVMVRGDEETKVSLRDF